VPASDLADLRALRRWLGGLAPGLRTWQIHGLFLRALRRAAYADRDRGHFGLGLRGYGHFTSPIRRYPDLFNHRVIKWALRHGDRPVPEDWRLASAAIAAECSASEERSEAAERELIRLKCLRWAEERVGESFRGRVVAVASGGVFVELDEIPIDGLVPRAEEMALLRQRPLRRERRSPLSLGDPVIVQISRVSLRERLLFFALRAMGRRAQELDPAALEAWVDLSPPEAGAGKKRKRATSRRAGAAEEPPGGRRAKAHRPERARARGGKGADARRAGGAKTRGRKPAPPRGRQGRPKAPRRPTRGGRSR